MKPDFKAMDENWLANFKGGEKHNIGRYDNR